MPQNTVQHGDVTTAAEKFQNQLDRLHVDEA